MVQDEISIACNNTFTRYYNNECDSLMTDFLAELQKVKNLQKVIDSAVTINYKTSEDALTVYLSSSSNEKIYSTSGVLIESGKRPTFTWDTVKEEIK